MQLKNALARSNTFFIIWAIVASFGAYFCMYAFRKPFSAGLYAGEEVWDLNYKSILIIAQVAGYTLSKFLGIRIISELKPGQRIAFVIALIVLAEIALLLFGAFPTPYNFFFLFINGLPLGMVWGVIFSFLEGRRFTEMLSIGLNISVIVASGILKTIYLDIHTALPGISEFWMPAFMGGIFLPPFLIFVWMLSFIPRPSEEDIRLRAPRPPMTAGDKQLVLKQFGFPIFCLVLFYASLVIMRDFRDNFMIEIWNEIDAGWVSSVLAKTEMITGLVVLVIIASLAFNKNNLIGFRLTNLILLLGILLIGGATFLFSHKMISGFNWMLFVGLGLFLNYTLLQTVLFDRMIALYRIRANAGYFVYICESIGYLGSVGLLLYKEFFLKSLSWSHVLIQFAYLQLGIGFLLLVASNLYLERRRRDDDKGERSFTNAVITPTPSSP